MSGPPKHAWLWSSAAVARSRKVSDGELRYTLTEGPEWDALMKRANFMLGHVHPESPEALILSDLLAYFGEAP